MNRRLGLALAAAGMAGAGAFVHTRVRVERRAHPARGGFAAGLHYVEAGFGPPAVFLHGMGSMLQDFELSGVFSRAADHYRAVALDRPGYGYSAPGANLPSAQAATLRQAFRRLGIAQPVIVAHSLGTLVAIAYALRYPDDVRGLVLASGYYYPTVRPDALVLVPPAIPLIGTQQVASPYPSTIHVAARGGPEQTGLVSVVLHAVTHPCPRDLSVLLVHDDVKYLLMNNVGGCRPLQGTTIEFVSDPNAPTIPRFPSDVPPFPNYMRVQPSFDGPQPTPPAPFPSGGFIVSGGPPDTARIGG